ncbi:hypothetical protein MNBD_GAMMA02-509 [hydrothermal vent metagenome]|uniref:Uncharacterized protein n=1 Tax=hydrothermal vent metagenome TaxID=652676 RepID=A0A3B0VV53_9ZZZZ
MRVLFICISFLNFSVVTAQTYVVSPNEPSVFESFVVPPIAGQDFFLWSRDSGCYFNDYTVDPEVLVDIEADDIRVFNRGGLGGSGICVPPPSKIFTKG